MAFLPVSQGVATSSLPVKGIEVAMIPHRETRGRRNWLGLAYRGDVGIYTLYLYKNKVHKNIKPQVLAKSPLRNYIKIGSLSDGRLSDWFMLFIYLQV